VSWPRAAGVLLHPTSLPGPNGIGELGAQAHRWLDVLAEAGVTIWQLLPLGPTGYGDSPYQVFSAFAGNPLLIDAGTAGDDHTPFPADRVDFARVIAHKRALLARAVAATPRDAAFEAFVEAQAAWLPDYALFMALKDAHGGAPWFEWPRELMQRDPAALAAARRRFAGTIARREVEQYLFATQLGALRRAAAERGIRLMGDVPIYVAHDSADVWVNRHLFRLRPDGRLAVQAGVPPDYFSETGQLWGNPLYDWEAVAADGFRWWIARLRAAFTQFDIVRLDHFRGFESYWEVAGDATTAEHGQWRPGPGDALFRALHDALGPRPIVAENLGVITPEVEALRARCGFPGMHVLQFVFGPDPTGGIVRPHGFARHAVVYTGTHDNDTIVGWWRVAADGDSTQAVDTAAAERAFAARYLDVGDRPRHWAMIRAAFATACDTAIVPLQDLLGLGSEARMNRPGRAEGNWAFRFTWAQLTPDVVEHLRALIATYERAPRRDGTVID
jgi:4-alpha-glucanotransferase